VVSQRCPFVRVRAVSFAGAGHLIIYRFLREGRAFVRLTDGQQEELAGGDIVVLPHGDAHFLGNGSPERPVDSLRAFAANLTNGLKLARLGGSGETTRFVCGYLVCEPRLSEVFPAGLPRLLKVRVSGEPSGQWLQHGIQFSVEAANGVDAGGGLVVEKLSEVLFVETLRLYINSLPADRTRLAGGRARPGGGQCSGAAAQGTRRGVDDLESGAADRFIAHETGNAFATFLANLRWRISPNGG
jgi:hypothetical protein